MSDKEVSDVSQEKPFTFDTLRKYFDAKFSEIAECMATKAYINRFLEKIDEHEKRVTELESRVAVMGAHLEQLKRQNDDLEQYQRRLSLRINGIPIEPGRRETAEESLDKVRAILSEIGVDIPDVVIDRAHRIGNVTVVQGNSYMQMIVSFTTWRHRTLVYRARKKSKHHRIRLDLTAAKASILRRASELLKSRKDSFAFADSNCRLCAKLGSKFFYFEDERELHQHLKELDLMDLNESGKSEFETY